MLHSALCVPFRASEHSTAAWLCLLLSHTASCFSSYASIADEVHAIRNGKNNCEALEAASKFATVRWGLTATPYNNRWRELRNLISWVTGDPDYQSTESEEGILCLVPQDAAEGSSSQRPEWCYKGSIPKEQLGFVPISRLIVIPYQTPAEALIDGSALCRMAWSLKSTTAPA